MSVRAFLLGLAMVASASSARAASSEDIVVQGRSTKEFHELLDSLAPSRSGRQIARWDDRVCTRIYGLEAAHAAFIKTRIDTVADMLRVSTAKSPKCRPNIVAVFALNADEMAQQIVSDHPELVGESERGAVNKRSKAAYLLPRPVRWFGQDLLRGEELPVVTRLRTGNRQVIFGILILVDLNKLQGISWGQLADFLAVVSMSRPQIDRVYDDPGTILSLFSARDQGTRLPQGLTALDKSFLVNLYKTQAEQTAERQRQQIRSHVAADIAKPGSLENSETTEDRARAEQ